jgi:chromosomal replication initiation ATPase DnaA
MSGWAEFAYALGGGVVTGPRDDDRPLEEILDVAARSLGFSLEQLRSRDRHESVVTARKMVMAEGRATGFTYAAIGRALDRDHTTVISDVRSLAR